MDLFKQYKELEKQIHDYFGYVEDWVVIPMEDQTEYYWQLDQDEPGNDRSCGEVRYADTVEDLQDFEAGIYYSGMIYTQRFLPKFVYRADDYTMISVDTQCDGNKFLMIFDNKKEIK